MPRKKEFYWTDKYHDFNMRCKSEWPETVLLLLGKLCLCSKIGRYSDIWQPMRRSQINCSFTVIQKPSYRWKINPQTQWEQIAGLTRNSIMSTLILLHSYRVFWNPMVMYGLLCDAMVMHDYVTERSIPAWRWSKDSLSSPHYWNVHCKRRSRLAWATKHSIVQLHWYPNYIKPQIISELIANKWANIEYMNLRSDNNL